MPCLGGDEHALRTPEISLYWEIGKPYRRQGYASEAARALADYAFKVLRVRRLFALTHPDNLGSLGVMRKLGMFIERARGACGILENRQPFPKSRVIGKSVTQKLEAGLDDRTIQDRWESMTDDDSLDFLLKQPNRISRQDDTVGWMGDFQPVDDKYTYLAGDFIANASDHVMQAMKAHGIGLLFTCAKITPLDQS